MNNTQLNNALLEILLHIGTSFELKKTINTALLSFVQQLDLAGTVLFEYKGGGYKIHTAKPKVFKSDKVVLEIFDDMIEGLTDIQSEYFDKSIPYFHSQEKSYYYIYELKEFGFLMLIRNTHPFREHTYKALRPIQQKFTSSLIACKNIEHLREKDQMLQQQSRLAQMGEMISMIAHQWRQPLGAISSTVIGIQIKLEIDHFNLDEKVDRDNFFAFMDKKHKNINEYVQFLSTTINDFRNFFKPDKEKELVEIISPIDRALKIVQTSMSAKGINISTDYQNNSQLQLFQNEMMQVVLNILKNCEDNFLEKKVSNAQIMISTKKDNDHHIISISDNGGGIAEDILPNIFDPYFSTKCEKNGTGLGLYMSKTMIEEHNNGILSAKNIDDGVCFEILLKDQ